MTGIDDKNVSRRKFLKAGSTVAAGAAVGGLAMPNVSRAQTTTLRMQSSWPTSDIFQEMAQQYVDRVVRMAGGRLEIDLLPAGAVVAAFSVQDAVHDGVIDAAHTVPAYWYGKNRAASLFGTGPVYGWDGSQMLAWIQFGGGKELYNELVQEILALDIVGFFCMPMPQQPLGWFQEPITDISQMEGMRYRTVGLATDVMQNLGVAVTQLPGGEIVPALERGVIDAFEFNNPTSDRRFGAQDVATDYMLGSFHQAAETFEIMFNRALFEGLPDELQAILEYGVEAANTANYGLAMDNYSRDLQGLIEGGTNIHRTPTSVFQAQLEAWDTVVESFSAEDEFFARVIASQREWAERVSFYILTNQAEYELAYNHYWPGTLPTAT